MSAGVKGFGPVVAALMLGAALVLALAACGGSSTPSTTAASTTTTTASTLPTSLPSTPTSVPKACSAWGTSWEASFNQGAKAQGNPERMVNVCCGPKNAAGVSHCALTLTLVGTKDRGCEVVDLNDVGRPVSAGRHIVCTAKV